MLGFDPSSPIVRELILSLARLSFPLVQFRHNHHKGLTCYISFTNKRQTEIYSRSLIDRQKDRKIDKLKHRKMDSQTDTVDRQTDRLDRQTDRQSI